MSRLSSHTEVGDVTVVVDEGRAVQACIDTRVDLEVFEPGLDGRWNSISSTLARGVWSECPLDVCFEPDCSWPGVTFTRTAPELASAPDAYRFRLRGAHGNVTGSKSLSVSYSGDIGECTTPR